MSPVVLEELELTDHGFCSRVNLAVLFEILINYLLVSVLTTIANEIAPSSTGVDRSRVLQPRELCPV